MIILSPIIQVRIFIVLNIYTVHQLGNRGDCRYIPCHDFMTVTRTAVHVLYCLYIDGLKLLNIVLNSSKPVSWDYSIEIFAKAISGSWDLRGNSKLGTGSSTVQGKAK